jgi:hypothetical protein
MKNIIYLLSAILFLSSCGGVSSNIIGNPIKFGSLEIAQHDFEKYMTWDDAKKACAALGDGWRLPTKEELNELYKHQDEIGGFTFAFYWSSSEDNIYSAWVQNFSYGGQAITHGSNASYVRAVRALKN